MKRKVIPRNKLGTKIPIFETATLYLILDRFNAPTLVWSILGTLWALLLIASFSLLNDEVSVTLKELEDE